MNESICSVVDCPNEGRRQVCPFDGGSHWHGCIHYTNEYGYPARLGMTFRDKVSGWLYTCDEHIAAIRAAMPAPYWDGQ